MGTLLGVHPIVPWFIHSPNIIYVSSHLVYIEDKPNCRIHPVKIKHEH